MDRTKARLDESREPFVSLSRLFLACCITPIEGLLRFRLDSLGEYDLSLGGLAPFLDLWTPLHLARKIAFSLNRHEELAALLEWETRAAWSVEDKEEGGVVHNWKIGSDRINPQEYSTALMLSTPFPRIHLVPPSSQIRTLLPLSTPSVLSSSPGASTSTTEKDRYIALWAKLTEWSTREYEAWVDAGADDAFSGGADASPSVRALSPLSSPTLSGTRTQRAPHRAGAEEADLAPLFVFTALSSLLHLLHLLPSSSSAFSSSAPSVSPPFPPPSLTHLPSLPSLARSSFFPPSSSPYSPSATSQPPPLLLQKLYLADALARLSLHAWREAQGREIALRRRGQRAGGTEGGKEEGEGGTVRREEDGAWREGVEERLKAVEEALRLSEGKVEEKGEEGKDLEVERLRRDFDRLEELVRQLSSASSPSPAPAFPPAPAPASPTPILANTATEGERTAPPTSTSAPLDARLALLVGAFVLGVAVGVGVVRVGG
ncbi:hypothetical protein JCM6882_003101 [Rhodosporidiobolus microsporus]